MKISKSKLRKVIQEEMGRELVSADVSRILDHLRVLVERNELEEADLRELRGILHQAQKITLGAIFRKPGDLQELFGFGKKKKEAKEDEEKLSRFISHGVASYGLMAKDTPKKEDVVKMANDLFQKAKEKFGKVCKQLFSDQDLKTVIVQAVKRGGVTKQAFE